ncbi:MAG: DUF1016 family protein [Bacilli bacterium]|nr:DUF1016 family protein [Bacilli bacterium]
MEQQTEKEYFADLQKIKATINENRSKAMVVVNSAMIITYYRIGEIINERKNWGNKYVEQLAVDLKEYGRGYSCEQLHRMSRFAGLFTKEEILSQAVTQIPWSSLLTIIYKSSSKEEMLWYIRETQENKWSRSRLTQQIELKAYQRGKSQAQSTENELVKEIAKDTLALDFIRADEIASEKDLKDRLIDNIIYFLQELGPGFALVGKEYRLPTPTGKNFYVDLLMYHTKIHAYVVIEVKLEEASPADFGQLNFYINAVDSLERTEPDNETVGLLLCKNAQKYVVETSIKGITTPIGVSKYKLLEELPNYLSKRLSDLGD